MLNLLPFLRHPTLQDLQKRDIEATEFALHDAKMALERQVVTVALFESRLKRLKGEQNANT